MIIETFLQDLRIGLRVLIKEKSFCALAMLVLTPGAVVVALFSALIPARRATRVDPMVALRAE